MFDSSEVGGILKCLILSFFIFFLYYVDHDLVFSLLTLCGESECILSFSFGFLIGCLMRC